MSFSGGRRRRPLYSSSLAMLLIISLLYIYISGQSTPVAAIRILPKRVAEEDGRVMEASPLPPPLAGKNQTEIFREYFKSRLSDLNITGNGTYADYKRRIPSCPDPLHN